MKKTLALLLVVTMFPVFVLARGAIVERPTEGDIAIHDLTLEIEIPNLSDEPIELNVSLDGHWFGNGVIVTTPSGTENQQIQIDTFDGDLVVEHAVPGIPSPIAVILHVEDGKLKMKVKNGDTAHLDLFAKVGEITLFDPGTLEELDWPTGLLGPMPNMVKIEDGVLQFLKYTPQQAKLAPSLNAHGKQTQLWSHLRTHR